VRGAQRNLCASGGAARCRDAKTMFHNFFAFPHCRRLRRSEAVLSASPLVIFAMRSNYARMYQLSSVQLNSTQLNSTQRNATQRSSGVPSVHLVFSGNYLVFTGFPEKRSPGFPGIYRNPRKLKSRYRDVTDILQGLDQIPLPGFYLDFTGNVQEINSDSIWDSTGCRSLLELHRIHLPDFHLGCIRTLPRFIEILSLQGIHRDCTSIPPGCTGIYQD